MQNASILAVFMLLVLQAIAVHAQSNSKKNFQVQISKFQSRSKSIRMEWYKSSSKGPHPTVILLHGQGGIEEKDGFFRYFAERLSEDGVNAGILHYFDRDGIRAASSRQMSEHFSDWLDTIGDAISYAQKESAEKKIGLIGHSLGAQLALIRGSRDPRVGCLVDMSGSLVYPIAASRKFPPVLILHGDKDRIVPLRKEQQLEATLKKSGSYFEKKIFPGQGHSFDLNPAMELVDLSSDFVQRML